MRQFRRTQTVGTVILAATVSALLGATLPFAESPVQGAPLGSLAAQPPPAPLSQATPTATPTATPAAAAAQPIPATPTLAAGAAAPAAPAGAAAAPPAAGAATAAGAASVAPQPTITMTPTAVVLSSVCSNRPPAAAAPAMPMPGAMPFSAAMPMTSPFSAAMPMASPFGWGAPSPFSPFSSLPLLGGLPGIPGFGAPMLAGPSPLGLPAIPAMPAGAGAPVMPAIPAGAAAPAPPADSPVVTCVNTTSGIALSWTPYRASSGTASYTVYQCDRNSMPGQPGCALVFTTDAPTLFGPVSMGYDYLVQAQAPPNTIIVSNRLSL
jgi:hypothetical protein